MAWTNKTVFKATDALSSKIAPPTLTGEWIQDITQAPTPTAPVTPSTVSDIQDQIDELADDSNYNAGYVFDQFDYFISTKPFYFYWEIPLGTSEIE